MAEIDITRGLKAGRALAQSVYSPYEEERKAQRELQTYRQKKSIDTESDMATQSALLRAMQGGQGSPGGGFRPTKFTLGGVTYENPEQELRIKATQALNDYSSDANQALVAIDKVESAARRMGDFKTGFWNQAGARGKFAIDKFAQDPIVANYSGVVAQELIPLARKIMEEKGPITEFDVARVEQGLGNATAPLATKIALLSGLRNKVKAALTNKAQMAGMTPDMFASNYPDLQSRAFGNSLQRASYNQQANPLRQEAQDAIARGADPAKVAELYRQQTGEDL